MSLQANTSLNISFLYSTWFLLNSVCSWLMSVLQETVSSIITPKYLIFRTCSKNSAPAAKLLIVGKLWIKCLNLKFCNIILYCFYVYLTILVSHNLWKILIIRLLFTNFILNKCKAFEKLLLCKTFKFCQDIIIGNAKYFKIYSSSSIKNLIK